MKNFVFSFMFFVTLCFYFPETVFSAMMQTEEKHDVINYSKKSEIIVGIPVFGTWEAMNWNLIRQDKKAMEFLSKPNVKIYPVYKYAKMGGSKLSEKAYAMIFAIMNAANLVGEPKEKIFAVIDELNKDPKEGKVKVGEVMKNNKWESTRKLLYSNCSQEEVEKRYKHAMDITKKIGDDYNSVVDAARDEKGLLMFPDDSEPFRLWILNDGKPAPYMIYDYKKSGNPGISGS